MQIWLLTQYYPPEPGAPSSRLSSFAKLWAKAGAQVTVFTGIPNHPKGQIHPDYQGKPAFMTEEKDGVTIKRHWLFVAANSGLIKRLFNQLSFAGSVLFANLGKPEHKPDIVVASSPSFFHVVSGWLLARRHGAKFIFEVRDLWPGIFVEMGVMKRGIAYRVLEAIEMFLYRRADAIVTVTHGFAADIAKRGIDPTKLFVITNGVADQEWDAALEPYTSGRAQALRSELQINPLSKVVLYIGNHGRAQALGQVIDAARLMMNRPDVVFVMVGDGEDKQRLAALAKGVPNVMLLPSQPKDQVWAFYALADVVLAPHKKVESFSSVIPSKIFEVMASATPLIACVHGEAAEICTKSGGAVVAAPEDPEKLARIVEGLLADDARREAMATAGRAYVQQHYLHSGLAGTYMGLFHKLAS